MYGNLLALIFLLLMRIEVLTSSILDEILRSRDKERDDFNPLKREEFRKVSYIKLFFELVSRQGNQSCDLVKKI